MSIVHDMIEFINKHHNELTKAQIIDLMEIVSPIEKKETKIRRTITKPIIVRETKFVRDGKTITRKAHRRARRGK